MSKLMSGALVVGMLFCASAASAAVVGTSVCGRIVQAEPGLLVAAGDLLTLGTPFRADLVTDDALPGVSGDTCSVSLPDSCGDISADGGPVVVSGTLLTIDGTSAAVWSATAYVSTFTFGGEGSGGPQATIDVSTVISDGARATGVHPGFADGTVGGGADVTVHLGGSDFTLTAQLETLGTACTNAVPTLPVWGFPLLGLGMLGSAGWMIRKRA